MRLQSLKGIKLYVIETQFLEPHILYVGLLDLVTIEIHSKDLLQNNDFHITSSIFLLSSVLVFYFFLILFFNSIVYRFFIARIFGVLPEYFRDWGGCRPPPPPWLVRLCSFLLVTRADCRNKIASEASCYMFPVRKTHVRIKERRQKQLEK